HRVGRHQAVRRIPAYRGVCRIRNPEVAFVGIDRSHLRGRVFVCTPAGTPQTEQDGKRCDGAPHRRRRAVMSWWTPRFRRGVILTMVLLVGAGGVFVIWEMSRYGAAV